jgi:CHASE2 domain-containing sensor protein
MMWNTLSHVARFFVCPVKLHAFTTHKLFKPLLGGALTVLCGIALWHMRGGERWVNASYDYIFLFGTRHVTNPVVLVTLDNESYQQLGEARGEFPRRRHAQFLRKLADDGAALVVFDIVFYGASSDLAADEELAAAIRRQQRVVLAAEQAAPSKPGIEATGPLLPASNLLSAAGQSFGVVYVDPGRDGVVRNHWPFGVEPPFPDLPSVVARRVGASLPSPSSERWLRYYRDRPTWTSLSYHLALEQPAGSFSNQIVFIGNKPSTPVPDGEWDEFKTPFTRWSKEAVGGVEILITTFLNLVNGDWLRRLPRWLEAMILIVTGALSFWALHNRRPLQSLSIALAASVGITLAGVSLSHLTPYWFPYLVIAGGQIPFALLWNTGWNIAWHRPGRHATIVVAEADEPVAAEIPDYELVEPHFGEGAYGKVWLAKNAVGQWQAFKAVYLEKFENNHDPYDREFNGIKRYKPIADKHPGLLRVDFVSRKKRQGFFYYVMELGDSRVPGWEENPKLYKPRDLSHARNDAPGRRLPIGECACIGAVLADALHFIHQQNLTHRDIKPSNIFFVNGRPKLGDVGLVSDVKPAGAEQTWVGTVGFMPPAPERPGTIQADVYALGMVLYIISTGREPALFPELSATLVEQTEHARFTEWNRIVLKACHPDPARRYPNAGELHADLVKFTAGNGQG